MLLLLLLMLLLLMLLLLINASGFGILRTIEALSQRFFMVCSIYGMHGTRRRMYGIGHGQRRGCLEGLSRLCRRLKSGKVHGSKLFAHARTNLAVVLVTCLLAASFLQENFIQCCIHGILQGRHVHGIRTTSTSAVETWRSGVWRWLVGHGRMPAMR